MKAVCDIRSIRIHENCYRNNRSGSSVQAIRPVTVLLYRKFFRLSEFFYSKIFIQMSGGWFVIVVKFLHCEIALWEFEWKNCVTV